MRVNIWDNKMEQAILESSLLTSFRSSGVELKQDGFLRNVNMFQYFREKT